MLDTCRTLVAPLVVPLVVAFAAAAAPTVALAENVGEPLPSAALVDFSQSEASAFDDYAGRLVLLEFFAHY